MSVHTEVQVSEQARMVRLSHGRVLPSRFWARMDDPAVPYVIRAEVIVAGGSPGVRQLAVCQREDEYPPGPPVSSSFLRGVRIHDFLRLAIDAAARPGDGSRQDRVPAGGDRLDAVALAYRAAKAEKRPVREAVMEMCGVATSQAARLIRAAREAGKIPPR